MAVLDEFREEREAMKQKSFKERAKYFWQYHKLQIIVPVVLVLIIVYIIHGMLTNTEEILNGVFLNCSTVENEYVNQGLIEDFAEVQGIDTDKYDIHFTTDVNYEVGDEDQASSVNQTANETLTIYAQAGTLDFVVGSHEVMEDLVNKKYFVDLTDVLSEEQCEKYESYFIYKETEAGGQVPLLIDMSQSECMQEVYGNSEETLAIGISLNAPHPEVIAGFIDYMMEK